MAETHFVGGDGEILFNRPVFPISRGINLQKIGYVYIIKEITMMQLNY